MKRKFTSTVKGTVISVNAGNTATSTSMAKVASAAKSTSWLKALSASVGNLAAVKTTLLPTLILTLLLSSQVFASNKVNINTASADTIAEALQGIGMVKAQAIVAYRESSGLFKFPEDIMQVKGIGESTFKKIKEYLRVNDTLSMAADGIAVPKKGAALATANQ